jgi:type II pantothenate kinase
MRIVIGLDVGGSTTKVVGFRDGEMLQSTLVQANDPLASAYGGVGKFLDLNSIRLGDVNRIVATGVGSSYLGPQLLERETRLAPEFDSVGLGGLYLAKREQAIVVSMGTGTSFVYAAGQNVQHIIGSGVGGGTLLGLGQAILHSQSFETIAELAETGDLGMTDLTIGDISRIEIPGLSADTTASNFGNLDDQAGQADLAAGIVNLVYQSVGTAAILTARLMNQESIVFTGNLTRLPKGREVLQLFGQLYQKEIIIPQEAEFATAVGAALYGRYHELS